MVAVGNDLSYIMVSMCEWKCMMKICQNRVEKAY